MSNQGGALKAREPMVNGRPNDLVTLVNVKTGERVTLFPIDANEYRDEKRHADHADWVVDGSPQAERVMASRGKGESDQTDAKDEPAGAVQTVRDLNPDPPPLPGQKKPATK